MTMEVFLLGFEHYVCSFAIALKAQEIAGERGLRQGLAICSECRPERWQLAQGRETLQLSFDLRGAEFDVRVNRPNLGEEPRVVDGGECIGIQVMQEQKNGEVTASGERQRASAASRYFHARLVRFVAL